VKHEISEVDERREHVLRQVADVVVGQRQTLLTLTDQRGGVGQGQTEQVGQTVEGAVVEERDHVAGHVQHAQVVHIDERLAVQSLYSYTTHRGPKMTPIFDCLHLQNA